MKCDLNENENANDVLDLPSLEIVTFGRGLFQKCHIAVFQGINLLLLSHSRSS